MASTSDKKSKAANKPANQEQIINGFNELRQQQRAVASKISELEMERKEHELVVETLKEVDQDRKCYRMVGGVLVERQVKDVLPALQTNKEQLGKLVESLTTQLESKGKEINEYRAKHNLHVRGEDEKQPDTKQDTKSSSTGVLVAKDT